MTRSDGGKRGGDARGGTWPPEAILGGIAAALLLLPLLALMAQAVTVERAAFLTALGEVVGEGRIWGLLLRSLVLATGAGALAVALGLPYAFALARGGLPAPGFFRGAAILPAAIPSFLLAKVWCTWIPLQGPLGAALLLALGSFPFVALLAARSLEASDRRLEEAARLHGGPRAELAERLRAASPGIRAGFFFAFLLAATDFAVTDYLSTVGPKYTVFADEIFYRWQRQETAAGALGAAMPLLVLTALALIPFTRAMRDPSLAGIGPRFRPAAPSRSRGWRAAALLHVLGILILSAAIPVGFYVSRLGSPAIFATVLPEARADVLRSLGGALAGATVAGGVGLLLARGLTGARATRAGWIAEGLAALPLALPAVLVAVAAIAFWNRPGPLVAVYRSPALLVLLLAARTLAIPAFAAASGLRTVGPRLEEAARLCGASRWRVLRGIVLPLAMPAAAVGWSLAYLFSIRELDLLILPPATNGTLGVRLFNLVHFSHEDRVAALALVLFFLAMLPFLLLALLPGPLSRPPGTSSGVAAAAMPEGRAA